MRIRNKTILVLNVVAYALILLPLKQLHLFDENYSTLSLNTRGYLYLFITGIVTGFIMAYETYHINNKNYAILMFLSLFCGTMIPHHVPYNLQGNLHLIFAYSGFTVMMIVTFMNILKKYNRYLINIYFLLIFELIFIYMHYGMINTIIEITIMTFNMFVNFYLYNKD